MSNKKMWSRCVVRGCIRDPSVSMHRLPKIQAVRQQWIQKLHLDSNLNGTVFVCQLHFRKSDYVGGNERKRLHCMAVPSVNLQYANIKTINTKSIESSAQEDREPLFDEETPEQNFVDKEVTGNSSINDEVMTKSVKNNDFAPDKNMHSDIVISTLYDEELLQRSVTDDLIIEVDSSCEMELITDDENQQFYEQEVASFKYHDLAARSNTISAEKSHCVCKHEAFAYHDQVTQTYPISSANKCIQVNMAYEELSRPWTLLDMLKNNSDLQSWTGIPSFSTLNNIVSCIDKLKSAQDQLKKFRSTPTMLTVFVMAKLKTDLTFKQLACLFALTPRTLGEYFHKFLPILKAVLEPVIFWPTTDQVGNNLPKCFKPDFEDCFVVMDCTETRIQRLKSLESQIKTYSHYKGKTVDAIEIYINVTQV
ncbi:uncharacterized protein LOC119073034 [Bradysia coprophila]|uniref:uncharacterized protein LOC119073034 n=1 Tax=Bradysia coprophila TaxID=38358 RepID=UPI00187DC22B|nr:uncharacterized protein LOC119073034 [Bradysia coprophila]